MNRDFKKMSGRKSFTNTQVENEVDYFFSIANQDNDDFLSQREIKKVYSSLGYPIDDKDVDDIFKTIDTDKDQKISREELVIYVEFQNFDTNIKGGDGYLNMSEWTSLCLAMDSEMSSDVIQKTF